MITGKLITFLENGLGVWTIWQRCQAMLSAINRIAELSKLLPINQPNFESISLSIPP